MNANFSPTPFIIGAGRSGNTLLRMMLDAHPDLAIPPETDFIPSTTQLCMKSERPRETFIEAVTNHWRWIDLQLSRSLLSQKISELDNFIIADGWRILYQIYAEKFGKQRWGDKTPFYLGHMRLIQVLFPEARFIHIIRDGRDVALSIKDLWFGPNTTHEVAIWWKGQINLARKQLPYINSYLEVRYEDLILHTESTLQTICKFIDLPWDAIILSYHERAEQRVKEVVQEFRDIDGNLIANVDQRHAIHALTQKPPQSNRIGKWRKEMSTSELELFKQLAGDMLLEFDYPDV